MIRSTQKTISSGYRMFSTNLHKKTKLPPLFFGPAPQTTSRFRLINCNSQRVANLVSSVSKNQKSEAQQFLQDQTNRQKVFFKFSDKNTSQDYCLWKVSDETETIRLQLEVIQQSLYQQEKISKEQAQILEQINQNESSNSSYMWSICILVIFGIFFK